MEEKIHVGFVRSRNERSTFCSDLLHFITTVCTNESFTFSIPKMEINSVEGKHTARDKEIASLLFMI